MVRVGLYPIQLEKLGYKEKHQGYLLTGKDHCEDTMRRWPSTSHEEKSQKKPNLVTLDLGLLASTTVSKCNSVMQAM